MPRNMVDYALLVVGAALAALLLAVFFAIALVYGPGGHAAVPQPDTLLYQQYGRAIAEGRPYQFIEGEPRSTGSTSHLYPWVLAFFYGAGCRGDGLASAGFLLHALFYVAFLALFWLAADRIAPSAARLAFLLCALSGQTIFTFAGQTDMGLFMVLSMAALVAALYERHVALSVLLFLAVLCRPEGIVLSAVLLLVTLLRRKRSGLKWTGPLGASAAGVAAALLVAALNRLLTGSPQFQSLAGKGFFSVYPFSTAVSLAAGDVARILKEVIFGLGEGGREFYIVPVIGGLLGIAGIAAGDWRAGRTRYAELWWLASAVGAMGLVALSDWQGLLHDRYLGWLLPAWMIYVARGVNLVTRRWRWTHGRLALATILVGYQFVGVAFFAAAYARSCRDTMSNVEFARAVHELLPPKAKVGVVANAGLAYYMPGRAVRSLSGIVTPLFSGKRHFLCHLEWLKHHPEDRFDAWLLTARHARDSWVQSLLGRPLASESEGGAADSLVLREVRWDTLDVPAGPGTKNALGAVAGLTMVDNMDIGYVEDEERCGYEKYTRVRGVNIHPLVATRKAGDRLVTDVGEVVIGSESFRIKATPGLPMRVVIRTTQQARTTVFRDRSEMLMEDYTFQSPLTLRVFIDDVPVGDATIDLAGPDDEFREVVVNIPGEAIKRKEIAVTVGGDHIAFAYWFYQ